ncbi:MAG: hypothetical protein PVI85_05965 [Methyloceanibacter sp.]|jgi:hypothetical protein
MARTVGTRHVEPFQFAARYEGEVERIVAGIMTALSGAGVNHS